ncbi:unnamed protein product [Amoebophrya sp. A120]|nr:unnamed protein product [Amoebophrya sp. A120]|eukprot:GSA120T00017488001.1
MKKQKILLSISSAQIHTGLKDVHLSLTPQSHSHLQGDSIGFSTESRRKLSAASTRMATPMEEDPAVLVPDGVPENTQLESAPPSNIDKFLKAFEKLNPAFDPTTAQRPVVCFFGDSDISHWRNQMPTDGGASAKRTLVNVGVGGAEMLHVAYYAERCFEKYRPDVVLLCAGENDIGSGTSSASTFSYFQKAYSCFRAKSGSSLPIIYMGTKPEPATESLRSEYLSYDGLIKERTNADAAFHFVDSWDLQDYKFYDKDELHLSPEGYEVWNRRVLAILDTGCD